MSNSKFQQEIIQKQYQTANNLNARIRLHQGFSTNKTGWYTWYFEHLDLPASARTLELGCGSAALWQAVLGRLPAGWQITLSDASEGMVAEAHQAVAARAEQFTFQVVDAQEIPFPDGSFDAVIANHMLYHVSDRPRAIAEMRRVLAPGGQLFAATNGKGHMGEIHALELRLAPEIKAFAQANPQLQPWTASFTLENGAEQLTQSFAEVRLERYIDNLEVTEAQPLVDYILSMFNNFTLDLTPERIAAFTRDLEAEIKAQGAIHITKSTGLFIAC